MYRHNKRQGRKIRYLIRDGVTRVFACTLRFKNAQTENILEIFSVLSILEHCVCYSKFMLFISAIHSNAHLQLSFSFERTKLQQHNGRLDNNTQRSGKNVFKLVMLAKEFQFMHSSFCVTLCA